MTPENMFIPIIEKMKNINRIRDDTLATYGKMNIRLSIRTLRFLDSWITFSSLKILSTLKNIEIYASFEPLVLMSIISMM